MARIVSALSLPRASSVVIRGPLGAGKTRVADEAVNGLTVRHRTIRRIAATSATSAIPFGAVAHLLPAGARDGSNPLSVIGALRELLGAVDTERTVLVIDDAPLLDLGTAGVISTLVHDGTIDVLATVRDDQTIPEPLVDVLLGDRATPIDLPPLSEDDISTLLHLALGGPVDGAVTLSLRERSDGNPLFIRELTRSAVEAGALVEVGGVWRLRGDMPGSARLRDVVEGRLDVVDAGTRPVLELLALCDVVDLDELEAMAGLEGLVELESRGLLKVVSRGIRQLATLGHPLHGEAIRMTMPPMRTRMVLRAHIAWVEANLPDRSRDHLQESLWRMDAGLPTDLESLAHGTRLATAIADTRSVIRLGTPVFDQRPTSEIGWLVAEAHYQAGQWAEAASMIDRSLALPARSTVVVDLATAKATIQFWGMGDQEGALATLAAVRDDPDMDAEDRDRLAAEHASVLVNMGRPAEALDELADAVHSDRLRTRLGAAVSYATALGLGGRTGEAAEIIDRALADRPEGDALTGIATVAAHEVAKSLALIESGSLQAGLDLAQDGYAVAVSTKRPLTQFWFTLLIGRAHLQRGAADSASRSFTRARALGMDAGIPGPTRAAVIGLVVAAALMQDGAESARLLRELDELPPFGFFGVERSLATAWSAVAGGDLVAARAELVAGAASALESGHVTSAIWMLHDVARLGEAASVTAQLAELAATTDSALSVARADHAAALVAGTSAALAEVADRFESMDANLLAAEAFTAAADAARGAGDQRNAAALTLRAERLLPACEGAISPALTTTAGGVEPLTDREREIAFLAAKGMTSRDIADRLFLSYRTVNNHLQHVYDKLGTRGRAGLREALGFIDDGTERG